MSYDKPLKIRNASKRDLQLRICSYPTSGCFVLRDAHDIHLNAGGTMMIQVGQYEMRFL